MDTKLLKQYIANKNPKVKQTVSEDTKPPTSFWHIPPAIAKYLTTEPSHHTYGIVYDAGEVVSRHPAVQAYQDKVRKELNSLPSSKENNAKYVKAFHNIPKDVLDKVAKDYGTTADKIYSMYSSFARD